MADHSVFINNMLLQHDNDNFQFTLRLVDWLKGSRPRDRVLFWERGASVVEFEGQLKSVPLPDELPPLPRLNPSAEQVEEFLTTVEDEGKLEAQGRRFLFRAFGSRSAARACLSLLLTIGVLGYGLACVVRLRQRLDADAALPVAALTGPGPDLIQQRHAALLRSGNLLEGARTLARECFADFVPRVEGRPIHPPPSTLDPRVIDVRGSWWQRWRLRRLVQRMWQLAHGTAGPVRPYQWRRFLKDLQTLRMALADGTVRIQQPA
jgi:hypothetical protein